MHSLIWSTANPLGQLTSSKSVFVLPFVGQLLPVAPEGRPYYCHRLIRRRQGVNSRPSYHPVDRYKSKCERQRERRLYTVLRFPNDNIDIEERSTDDANHDEIPA